MKTTRTFHLGAVLVAGIILSGTPGQTSAAEAKIGPPAVNGTKFNAVVSADGTVPHTNISGTLAAGDSFKLFNAGVYNNAFNSIVWPTLNGSLYWTNKLAVDGTVAVVSPVNSGPTNIVFQINGNLLELSWPADHVGWWLESQTNTLGAGLGTNWVIVPGSSATNYMSFPFGPGNGSAFFRLVYP